MKANDFFKEYTGTSGYYQHSGIYAWTDGAEALAKKCEAYWFLDLIVSQQNAKLEQEEFQVWKLKKVNDDCEFVAICTDGNKHKLTSQSIPYSDFPYDEAEIWLVKGIMMLPSEY
jgi:hypothetical protein